MLYLKSVSVSVIVYNMTNHVLENQQEHDSRDKMQWRMEYTNMGRFFLLKESDIRFTYYFVHKNELLGPCRVKAYVVFESEDSTQASLAHNMEVLASASDRAYYIYQSLHDCDSMSEDFHAPYVLSAIDLLHTLKAHQMALRMTMNLNPETKRLALQHVLIPILWMSFEQKKEIGEAKSYMN
ncbi:hypothetical protein Tco_0371068 [Tanacetum coccineum]